MGHLHTQNRVFTSLPDFNVRRKKGHLRTQNRVFTSLPDFNPGRKMCNLRTQTPSKFMHFLHIFYIIVNFLPFALVDPGPADGSVGFGSGAAAGAQAGDSGAAVEGADLVTLPENGDLDVRHVHGYGKVANVEAGMVFLGGSFWDPPLGDLQGISVRPLGAKTSTGRKAGGDAVTLVCPF